MKLWPFLKVRHNQAILALIIANTIWGAASPIFKLALENIPPFTLAFLRFFGAALILLPFTINNISVNPKDLPKMILLALFGVTFHISFYFLGLLTAPSINAPIILSSGPIFLYLAAIFTLHEKIRPRMLYGTLVSLLGVLAIIGEPLLFFSIDGQVKGNLFLLLSTFGVVGHAVISKEILPRYRPETVTFWSFLIGSLTFLPLFIKDLTILHPFATIDIRGWTGIVFGLVFSSALAYSLFEFGIKYLETQEVGIFTYIDPVAAIVIAIPLLGEKITPVFLLGSLFVFSGIFIAEGRLHWHPLYKLRK